MRKVVVTLVLMLTLAVPLYAQQDQQQQTPIAIAPDLFNRANDALTAKDYQSAMVDLSLFILLNPTYSPAYYQRAQAYANLNDVDHALQDVDRALNTVSSSSTADYTAAVYTLRGQIDQHQQQYDDAVNDYTQSISIQPSVTALANRGILYLSDQKPQSALDDFNAAIALDDSNPTLYIYRGVVHTALDDAPATGADYLQYLSIIQTAAPNRGTIQTGQAVSLPMDRGVIYLLSFTATAGQYASALAVARTGDVDPLMVLLDGQGNPLSGDDDSGSNGSALILNYKIPTDGQYALVVGHSLGGYTGTILLQFQLSDQPAQ